MTTEKKRKNMWKVVEIPYWCRHHQHHRCAWLTYTWKAELGFDRDHVRYVSACKAKRLAKQLTVIYARSYPYQQEQYRMKYEARPMGSK